MSDASGGNASDDVSKVCEAGEGDPGISRKSIHKHLSLRRLRVDSASLRELGLQRLPRGRGDAVRVVRALHVHDLRLDGHGRALRRLSGSRDDAD